MDESVRMYIYRVYEANGHRVGTPFLERHGIRPWFQAMGRLCGAAIHEAPFAWTDEYTQIPGRRLENRWVKYCCGCAAEFGYQLWIIDYYDSQFCPVHLQPLLYLCHACGKPVTPREILDNRCSCGFDLKETPVIGVRADLATWELVIGRHLKGMYARAQINDNRLLLPLWIRSLSLPGLTGLIMEFHWLLSTPTVFNVDDVIRESLVDWPRNFRKNLLIRASREIFCDLSELATALRSLNSNPWRKWKEEGITAETVRQLNLLILDAEAGQLKSCDGEMRLIQDPTTRKNS